ncbi:MAG: GNAT family N-acetyltransferase [Phycisphaerales bacterium]|nr:GNAT family N-acetyltransferase [Phycisphaerales bacterium]
MDGTDWTDRYRDKLRSADQAVAGVRRGQRVFIGSGCAEPQELVKALVARGESLADTQIIHILTLGTAPYVDPTMIDRFHHNAFFIGPNTRQAVSQGRADYTPAFLSEIPRMFRHGRMPIDVALIQVSPPDEHGYCSYGVSTDIVKSAAECACEVYAEVNPNMPRALGDSFIHVNRISGMIPMDKPVLESKHREPDEIAQRIGRHIADLIDDGSTLQMGIGTIPDAVLANLTEKKDLGIHTEMFADGVVDLVERGIINGSRKTLHRGKIIASFVMGTRRLYDFIDNNPMCEFHPTEYTNDPFRIAQNDKMIAINSALQIDLTGQVCADSLGEYFYSGIGGQVDFVRGAARSNGGKPIVALPSTARDGTVSRIVPTLYPGAGVVTSRGDVHYVVTEWGAANLHGKTVRERALALIHIAHPDFREQLMKEARERHVVPADQPVVLSAGAPELEIYQSDVTLADGMILRIRPIRPTDEELLRDMFYSLSPDTVLHRFFHVLKAMPHAQLKDYVNVDYAKRVAIVAVAPCDEGEMVVGVARYGVDAATDEAEVAFVMRDAWQGRGIGTHMFKRLVAIGRDRGITSFTAEVMVDNKVMVRLFNRCALGPVKSTLRDGAYHLAFSAGPKG